MNQEKRELEHINTSQNTTSGIKKIVERFKGRKYAC